MRPCSARSKQWPWIRASWAGCWDTVPSPSPVPEERTKAFPGYRTRWNSADRSRVRSWPRRSGGAERPQRRPPGRRTPPGSSGNVPTAPRRSWRALGSVSIADGTWCRSLDKADRLAGALLGEALGDALGFVVEAQPPEVAQAYVDEWLRRGRAGQRSSPHYPFGQYSDDTQLARELLLSFRERRLWDPEDYAHRLAQLFGQARDVGAGSGTRSAALRIHQGLHWSRAGTPLRTRATAAPYARGHSGSCSPISPPSLGWLESRAGSPIWILVAAPERWR